MVTAGSPKILRSIHKTHDINEIESNLFKVLDVGIELKRINQQVVRLDAYRSHGEGGQSYVARKGNTYRHRKRS